MRPDVSRIVCAKQRSEHCAGCIILRPEVIDGEIVCVVVTGEQDSRLPPYRPKWCPMFERLGWRSKDDHAL